MVDFGTILKRGKRRAEVKEDPGVWGRCESCDDRRLLRPYRDQKGEIWKLCDECSDSYIKEETE